MYKANITGKYKIYVDGKLKLDKTNLITSIGEQYFLQRWITNTDDILNIIGVGTEGNIAPKKSDSIDNGFSPTTKTTVNKNVDYANRQIVLTGNFTSDNTNNINEIGVLTSANRLISHDCFEKITIPSNSTLSITYIFTLSLGLIKTEWTKLSGYTNVYKANETQTVKAVEETDTQSGYILYSNLTDVDKTRNSFYYANGKLYVHTSDDNAPNNHTIEIKY